MIDRLPPQSLEAEQSVLGAILIDRDVVIEVAEFLKPEDFYLEKHQVIFESVQGLFEKNVPVDLITVSEALKKAQRFDMAGGDPYLLEISSEVVSSANVAQHCQIVKEKSLLRKLIGSATKMLEKAYLPQPEKVVDAVHRVLYR